MISIFTALTGFLASCSSAEDATESNFRAALQSWFDEHGECVNVGDMPAKIRVDTYSRSRTGYEAMAAAGLLTIETKREEQPSYSGKHKVDDYLVYRPTSDGTKVISQAAHASLGRNKLCFARRHVIEVMSWTQPDEMMGLRVSQVHYTYRLDDIAPWSADPGLRAAFPKMAKAVDIRQGEDKASLILTNEGWQHEKALRR